MATRKEEYVAVWTSLADNLTPLSAVDQLVISNVGLKTVDYVTELEQERDILKQDRNGVKAMNDHLRQELQTLRDRQAKRDADVWGAARDQDREEFEEFYVEYKFETLEDWEASKK